MIFDGKTGGRWIASSILTARPSWAMRVSSRRTTSTTLPSRRIRRVSRILSLSGGLSQVFGIGVGAVRTGESAVGTVEPQMDLAGADRVLVLAVLPARRRAVALTQSADHHEVMPEPRFRFVSVEIRHCR